MRDRINDAKSRVVITADGGYRRGHIVPLKANADAAIKECPSVNTVIVARRTRQEVEWQAGRDLWWDDLVKDAPAYCAPEPMDSEDLLSTCSTRPAPPASRRALSTPRADISRESRPQPNSSSTSTKNDTYWCTADIGWVTGHSYIVYGPLLNGVSVVMYEGTPDFLEKDRFWRIIEKYGVTILYTAPTAIRSFIRWGEEFPRRCNLSSLRLLGTVGEPINPEAWVWYWKVIGGGRCPIVDTWWQTETGHILITPLPGITVCKPGSATLPFPGIEADVVNDKGEPAQAGYLVLRKPWPGMLRGIYGDPQRYKETYWSRMPGVYFTGDGAKRRGSGG